MKTGKIILITIVILFAFSMTALAQDIHKAAQEGDTEKVKSILEQNPTLLDSRNDNNLTPLIISSIHGNIDVVRLLIKKGADINAGDNEGSNALHNAAASGQKEVIELLLSKGVDVNLGDNNGMTALHFVATRGYFECGKLLVAKGAEVNVKERNGRTPLFFAVRSGNIEFCQLLIDEGAEVDIKNNYGRTPLTYAIWRNSEPLVELLVKKGADINFKDVDGNAPLHQACREGKKAIAKLLIANGANTELKDNTSHTPMHIAANYGFSEIVKLLIAKGVNVNVKDDGGDTPIHGAAWSGDKVSVELLLKNGAKMNVKNKGDKIPLDYAVQAGHEEIVKLLSKKEALNSKAQMHLTDVATTDNVINSVKMTVLYDNYVHTEGTIAKWGFSCLIEGTEKTILFDTGGESEVLWHNINHLNIDLKKADEVVISHNHWDHTGGLFSVLEKHPDLPIYIPQSFPYDFVRRVEQAKGKVIPVDEPVEICSNVFLTGEMGNQIKEQD